ncbi:hypothetical protein FOA52_007271 [Chlamydomonas sp. UWO 241]|nr:hypothetical protein FOA52_007271 [Chlamydomonas sp. UWO 241]
MEAYNNGSAALRCLPPKPLGQAAPKWQTLCTNGLQTQPSHDLLKSADGSCPGSPLGAPPLQPSPPHSGIASPTFVAQQQQQQQQKQQAQQQRPQQQHRPRFNVGKPPLAKGRCAKGPCAIKKHLQLAHLAVLAAAAAAHAMRCFEDGDYGDEEEEADAAQSCDGWEEDAALCARLVAEMFQQTQPPPPPPLQQQQQQQQPPPPPPRLQQQQAQRAQRRQQWQQQWQQQMEDEAAAHFAWACSRGDGSSGSSSSHEAAAMSEDGSEHEGDCCGSPSDKRRKMSALAVNWFKDQEPSLMDSWPVLPNQPSSYVMWPIGNANLPSSAPGVLVACDLA